jgi:hypothetical protein
MGKSGHLTAFSNLWNSIRRIVMSDNINPYQSPQNPVNPAADGSARLTETMILYLKRASPWLRFMGIMGFIVCGIVVLIGLIFLFALPVMGSLWGSISEFGDLSAAFGTALGAVIGAVYFFAIAALSFFPALFSFNFGNKIRAYLQSGSDQDLELAFKNNKSLWKFNGILTIIGLAFIPVMVIIGIVVGIAAAFAG